ncbi:MAG: glutathione S-transferase [Candidatus Tokpelaia sp. JSC085]|nr:MAG: glutathione S-transferase [Candidatus Tokpelaia sp. JSC085]
MSSQNKPIQFYYWPTPNGWKISIMLEELSVPYHVNYVNLGRGEQFKPEFLKISPNNRIPVIVDPEGSDGHAIPIFESGAILLYLARKFGCFYPENGRKRVLVEEWLMWQMAGLGPMSGQAGHFRLYASEKVPYAIERYTNEVNRLYGVILEYLAESYSIADIACIGWVSNYMAYDQTIEDFPHLHRWLRTMRKRPAVQKGLELGRHMKINFSTYGQEQN